MVGTPRRYEQAGVEIPGVAGTKPRKPKTEKQLVEALTRDELRIGGSEEAVYFVLRGLGVPVLEGAALTPRIEVSKSEQPDLGRKLRSLGLKARSGVFTLYPRPRADDAPRRKDDADAPKSPSGSPSGSRRLPALRSAQQEASVEALFERLQRPKHAQSERGLQEYVAAEMLILKEAEEAASRSASPSGGARGLPSPSPGASPVSRAEVMARLTRTKDDVAAEAAAGAAAGFPRAGDPQPPKSRAAGDPATKAYFENASRPHPMKVKEKRGCHIKRVHPNTLGPAPWQVSAQRHLDERRSRIDREGDPRDPLFQSWASGTLDPNMLSSLTRSHQILPQDWRLKSSSSLPSFPSSPQAGAVPAL